MGSFFWKWLLRPIVIIFAGMAGVKTLEDSPVLGGIFILFSVASAIMLFADLA